MRASAEAASAQPARHGRSKHAHAAMPNALSTVTTHVTTLHVVSTRVTPKKSLKAATTGKTHGSRSQVTPLSVSAATGHQPV